MNPLTDNLVRAIAWLTFPDAHSIIITFLGDEHAWITCELGPMDNPYSRDFYYDPACQTFTGAQGTIDAVLEEV